MVKRIKWIDFMKGIMLLMICFSHFGVMPQYIYTLIRPTSMYWVPMFFMLSGFLYNPNKQISFSVYAKSKTRTLLIPYLFFGLVFIILDMNIYHSANVLKDNLLNLFIEGNGPSKATPLWFVWLLYLTTLTGYWILKLEHKSVLLVSVLILLSVVSLYTLKVSLPFRLCVVPSSIVFYVSGQLIRRVMHLYKTLATNMLISFVLLCLGIYGFIYDLGDFHFNQIISYPMFYISPICFFFFSALMLSRFEDKFYNDPFARFFLWVAKNGIVILSVHVYLVIIINKIIDRIDMDETSFACFLIKFLFVFIVLFLFVVPLCNSWLYHFIGKKKMIWTDNYKI